MRLYTFLLTLLLLLAFGLRLYTIDTKAVWLDEAFSIWLANQPILDLWWWLIKIDQHPPLYYILLHLWQQLFGDLQGTVRLLSALSSTLTIPFFYGAVRRFFDHPTAVIASFILATAPFHIRYAQETRMYSLLTLAVAITLYLLTRLLTDYDGDKAPWWWPIVGIAQAAVMLTHNTAAVFFPLALNLMIGGALLCRHHYGVISSLTALNRPGFGYRWLRIQAIAWLCWLPWSIPFIIQSIGVDREFWIPFPTGYQIYEALHNFHLAHQPYQPIPWLVGDLFYWLLAAVGISSLRRKGALLALLLSLFFVPILGELLVSLRRPIFSDRTLIWVTLPYYWLVAAGIRQSGRWLGKWYRGNRQWRPAVLVSSLLLAGIVALNSQALFNYYYHFPKEGWDEAATYVATHAEPGDLILFHATWIQIPFDYYFRHYRAANDEQIVRRGVPVDLFDRGLLEPKMTTADLPYLWQLMAEHQQIWLIYSHDWYTDPQGVIPQALNDQRTLVTEANFLDVRVLHYQ